MAVMVERLQVEEGFLAGLDLRFDRGLNVIIGPRGAGKTSVIELLRFCLGVRGRTEEFDIRSQEHARAVLGPGRVTVTLRDGDQEILVSRTVNEDHPRTTTRYRAPLVFSQAEIERVGLEAHGRLAIIDGLADAEPESSREEQMLEATIRSYTVELRQLGQDIEITHGEIQVLSNVPTELKAAVSDQQAFMKSVNASAKQRERLETVGRELSVSAVRLKQVEQAIVDLSKWNAELSAVVRKTPALADWPANAGSTDLLQDARSNLQSLSNRLRATAEEFGRLLATITAIKDGVQTNTLKLEEEARVLRRELDQLKSGAGSAAQRVTSLQEKAGQLQAQLNRAADLVNRVREAREKRNVVLTQLGHLRDRRYEFRNRVADSLSKELGPTIMISIEQGGDAPAYAGTIQGALRGSGLHYTTLGPLLASAMSPKELAESVELGDRATIARLADIDDDRAAKIIAAIARVGTEDIITAPIHDRVTMNLLVGQEYKPTTDLSTGQRCTVVLSVLLGYKGRTLIIDQPEDHLDNSFIVDTLIESILRRKTTTQLVFTTHNANIPVLGEAEMVILLGSDGQRGFVRHAGALHDPRIVNAITTVMEGGHEAFKRRATFYRTWLKSE